MIGEFIKKATAERDRLIAERDPMAAGFNLLLVMLINDLVPLLPRAEVMAFAMAMEAKLSENEDKGHWCNDGDDWHIQRLDEEKAELIEALRDPDRGRKRGKARILGEAADVANFAMFLADNHGALEKP